MSVWMFTESLHNWFYLLIALKVKLILTTKSVQQCGLPEGPNNFVVAGNRPQSSTSPIIMLNASTNAVIIGASGGSLITTATLMSTINHLFLGFP